MLLIVGVLSLGEALVQVQDLVLEHVVLQPVAPHDLAQLALELLQVRLPILFFLLHLLQQLLDGLL